MKKIAITGNLATGKSTVLKILESFGFPTFSCDNAVKELYQNEEVKKQLQKIFGKEILYPNGNLNKRKILEKILEDQELKNKLENFIHPLVKEKLLFFFNTNKEKKLVFAEVPLLFEVGWESFFDEVWVITCSEKTQRERILKKGLDIETGKRLLKSQISLKEKKKRADRIISTEKGLEELREEIKEMLKGYLKD